MIDSVTMTRKILYSPGYGAGWTTWNRGPASALLLTYEPIVAFIERGGQFSEQDCYENTLHPLLAQLMHECTARGFGDIYVGGASQLAVMTVEGRVRIDEYDGFETVVLESESEWM